MRITNREEAQKAIKGLKIGDKVRIKDNIDNVYCWASPDMKKYCGKVFSITYICQDTVLLDCDDKRWRWSADAFDIIEETKVTKDKKEISKDSNHEVIFNGKGIKRVIFNDDATIVLFSDGTKSVTKRLAEDEDNKEHALAMALVKSVYGKNYFKDIFERFLPEYKSEKVSIQVGDRVRIKSWKQLIKENGQPDLFGDIYVTQDDN